MMRANSPTSRKGFSKEETRKRLMLHTRYDDDFLKKPKLPYATSSRRHSSVDPIDTHSEQAKSIDETIASFQIVVDQSEKKRKSKDSVDSSQKRARRVITLTPSTSQEMSKPSLSLKASKKSNTTHPTDQINAVSNSSSRKENAEDLQSLSGSDGQRDSPEIEGDEDEAEVEEDDEDRSTTQGTASSFAADLKLFENLQAFLKLDKRMKKLSKDLAKVDEMLAASPHLREIPLLTIRDMLSNRVRQEEMLVNFLHRTMDCLHQAQQEL